MSIYGAIRLAEMAGRAGRSNGQARPADAKPPEPPPNPLEDVIRGPGAIVPGENRGDGNTSQPGDLKYILDDSAGFAGQYLAGSPAQVDAMVLYAAATHALSAFPAFGRMLFTSEHEASGKTMAMTVTAALSASPLDATGTPYALTSALAAAANTPEQQPPTLYYDEISSLFGRSGLAASRNPVADILRKGYKAGAVSQWSVNRVNEKFSIFTPFLMTGLRVAVPRDIRSRSIVIVMEPGSPAAYFDARTAEPEAAALAACLKQAAGSRMRELALFRAKSVHPKLKDRKLEVWEPLFAVAWIYGGQEWLNRCLAAFRELALSEADQVVLTPRQQILRDAAHLLDGPLADAAGSGFAGGLALADEMRRLGNPLYASRSEAGMAKLIADAMPVPTTQKRVNGKLVRGYFASEIREAWEAVRPSEAEDAEIEDEDNPFDVTDDTGDAGDSSGVTDVTGDAPFSSLLPVAGPVSEYVPGSRP